MEWLILSPFHYLCQNQFEGSQLAAALHVLGLMYLRQQQAVMYFRNYSQWASNKKMTKCFNSRPIGKACMSLQGVSINTHSTTFVFRDTSRQYSNFVCT